MKKVWVVIAVIFIVAALSGCTTQKVEEKTSVPAEIPPGFLVTTEELATLMNHENVVIIDARNTEDYQKFHLLSAVNMPSDKFREPMKMDEILDYKKNNGFAISPEMAERIFSEAGIDASTRVIVYDSITFPHASIVWALLKYFGHDNMLVLKGGFEKWVSEGRSVTAELPKVQKKTFVVRPRPEMVASREWLLNNKENVVVLDMRSFEEYLGIDPAGNPRGGHVPGAISIEWLQLAVNGTVKSPTELQEILDEAGVARGREIVTYCNIGIGRSTYGFMVLKMLGYDKVRVYGGSFEDWSTSELQVATTEVGFFEDWIGLT